MIQEQVFNPVENTPPNSTTIHSSDLARLMRTSFSPLDAEGNVRFISRAFDQM